MCVCMCNSGFYLDILSWGGGGGGGGGDMDWCGVGAVIRESIDLSE